MTAPEHGADTRTDRRRSKFWAAPSDEKPPDERVPASEHSHPLPAVVKGGLVMLVIAVIALTAMVVTLVFYTMQFRDYVNGRGEYRDAEQERLEQEINEGHCDWLERLPVSPLLDQLRDEYDCGPGIPLDQFAPEIQQQFSLRSAMPQVVGQAELPPVGNNPNGPG